MINTDDRTNPGVFDFGTLINTDATNPGVFDVRLTIYDFRFTISDLRFQIYDFRFTMYDSPAVHGWDPIASRVLC